MPGWRGYLPETVDRDRVRRGAAVPSPASQRLAALGALAACVLAGGAVMHARSTGSPDAAHGPADDVGSLTAGSAAWTREATPVISSLDTELRRTEEVRQRWDASPLARRDGPPPGPVIDLFQRRTELVHHRDALRAALAALRSEPSASVLAGAWPQLRAAQDMLRALASARGRFGDPVEVAVLRLVSGDGAPDTAGGDPAARRATSEVTDPGSIALVARTSELARRATAAPAAQVARALRPAGERVVAVADLPPARDAIAAADTAATTGTADETPAPSPTVFRAATEPGGSGGGEQEQLAENVASPRPEPSSPEPSLPQPSSPGPTTSASADPTILTFARPPSDIPDPGPDGAEASSPTVRVTSDAPPAEETSAPSDRLAE